jgi:hypothetical protein
MTQYIGWPTGEHDVVRARIAAHRAADEIVQGSGWDNGKGCAIGCSLDEYSHAEYVRVVGGDLRFAALVDNIHETLPLALALDWPGRVAASVRPGADLTLVPDRWFAWQMRDLAPIDEGGHCATMAALYDRRLAGDEPAESEWSAAVRAAGAARDARDARDARAAWSAGAARAAGAAGAVRAARAARAACTIRQADALIAILDATAPSGAEGGHNEPRT